MARLRLRNACALLALGLLIIWLRSRWVVLTPRRAWGPSPSDVVLGPLPFEVEWRVAVGCGFSGFFVEVALGFMLPLASSGSFRLLCGKCDESFLTEQLTVKEADAIRKTWVDESARTRAQTRASIVIEHGEPCSIRRWAASDRPLWVISRTMTEGDLAPEQADCLRAADEVRPPPCPHQQPPPCSRRPAHRQRAGPAPSRQALAPSLCARQPRRVELRPSPNPSPHPAQVWVPTWWHVERFVSAGVPRPQLRVVPEPVELETFAPHVASASAAAAGKSRPFVFLSNFKWEQRKGWDLLLRAYWAEFKSAAKGCALPRVQAEGGAALLSLAPSHPPDLAQPRPPRPAAPSSPRHTLACPRAWGRRVLLRIKTYLPSWESGPRDLNEWLDAFAAEQAPRRPPRLCAAPAPLPRTRAAHECTPALPRPA